MRMIIRAFLNSPIWFLERRFGVGLDRDTTPLGRISTFFFIYELGFLSFLRAQIHFCRDIAKNYGKVPISC